MADVPKFLGRTTYEGRYVIIRVPAEWEPGDPLPAASPDDQWFDKLPEFTAALNAPWDHAPINRHPWNTDPPGRPAPLRRLLGRLE
jgi:hypothetical protein